MSARPSTALTMTLSRRALLAGAAAAGLLSACGKESSDPVSGSKPTTRQVTSDNGPVTVPSEPERVVAAVGSFDIDMVAVGVMPVLTTTFAGPWVDLDPSVKKTKNIPPTVEEL